MKKDKKVPVYVTHLEGALNVVQWEYPMMLSMSKVQKHLRDCLIQGLCNQLCNSMHYLYDNPRIIYLQLMTSAYKAESK